MNHTCLYSPAAQRHRTLVGGLPVLIFRPAEDRRLRWPAMYNKSITNEIHSKSNKWSPPDSPRHEETDPRLTGDDARWTELQVCNRQWREHHEGILGARFPELLTI